MRRYIVAVLAALALAVSFAPASHAGATAQHKRCCWGTGQMSGDEFDAIQYQNYKGTVEGSCNCTGTLRAVVPQDTYLEQQFWYYDNPWFSGGVSIAYYRTSSGSLRVFQKEWCHSHNSNNILTNCGPATYWQLPKA